MIRIDAIWLATEPMDMRAGTDTALARVVEVFGAAKPHCAYLFANRRANRMKVLVHGRRGHLACRNAELKPREVPLAWNSSRPGSRTRCRTASSLGCLACHGSEWARLQCSEPRL